MSTSALPTNKLEKPRLLVASPNASFRKMFAGVADESQGRVEEVSSGAHALSRLEAASFDVLVLDRNLPDLDSLEIAELARRRFAAMEVRLVDSRAGFEKTAAEPAAPNVASETESPAAIRRQSISIDPEPLPGMVGRSRAMQHVYRMARLVAPRDTSVLITGETGTGKEVVARGIHQLSARAQNPFVVVNCAAIPEALLEAELFGHAKGAFTGAVQSRIGRIHMAHGGTFFLDEVGDLPLSMQAKLLRFLQDGEVQRLGSSEVFRVDVRVICATNVRLLDYVKQKLFRQDLYYRIAVFPIELPPLRERKEDMAPLAEHFLADLCRSASVTPKRLSASALAVLRQSPWAGNVRELQHAVERAFILAGEEPQLHVEHFSRADDPAHFREI
ncbi:MAG TPA: sigma-54 dependent transcriptional regulator [Candidatus Acidoferrum sp.]|nr:sigma-54 dependent transcriptional regulator [Candidatus Acidoferrum sp.]